MVQGLIKDLIPILQAFVDYKVIEYYDTDKEKWLDLNLESLWAILRDEDKIRIKPELKPKLVEFDYTADLVGREIFSKHTEIPVRSMIVYQDAVGVQDYTSKCITYKRLLDDYTFYVSIPCGKYVE